MGKSRRGCSRSWWRVAIPAQDGTDLRVARSQSELSRTCFGVCGHVFEGVSIAKSTPCECSRRPSVAGDEFGKVCSEAKQGESKAEKKAREFGCLTVALECMR